MKNRSIKIKEEFTREYFLKSSPEDSGCQKMVNDGGIGRQLGSVRKENIQREGEGWPCLK